MFSCKPENRNNTLKPKKIYKIDDTKYIQNSEYSKGDSRRYGVFPNQKINNKALNNCIALANKGLPITFSKGYYNTNIVLKGVSNVNFLFDNVILSGSFQIIEKEQRQSQQINIEGKLTVLDKLFIRKSSNISFDSLYIRSDTINNILNKKNRGASIYVGSKNISFDYLEIDNTGGEKDIHYKYVAAALQVHGWNNNPEYITINTLQINNADRTSLYLTGKGHLLKKVSIKNFGLGVADNMYGLEDASQGEERIFAGAWVNKCNNCEIDTLEIKGTFDKNLNSLKLGVGKYHQPSFINNIHFSPSLKKLPIKDDELTNILVKNEY